MAQQIASVQSTGTFTELPGEIETVRSRCAAKVIDIHHLDSLDTPSIPDPTGKGSYCRADAVIFSPLEAVGTDITALMTDAAGGVSFTPFVE